MHGSWTSVRNRRARAHAHVGLVTRVQAKFTGRNQTGLAEDPPRGVFPNACTPSSLATCLRRSSSASRGISELERRAGFEPATMAVAQPRSTTELSLLYNFDSVTDGGI